MRPLPVVPILLSRSGRNCLGFCAVQVLSEGREYVIPRFAMHRLPGAPEPTSITPLIPNAIEPCNTDQGEQGVRIVWDAGSESVISLDQLKTFSGEQQQPSA